MAREVWAFDATINAGTPKATPATVSLAMPARVVRRVQITVPPGPRGELGFALGSSGFSVVPQTRGQFIVTDNEFIDWPLEEAISSGAWALIGYNTGTYNHTVRIRFLVDLPELVGLSTALHPIANDAVSQPLVAASSLLPFGL